MSDMMAHCTKRVEEAEEWYRPGDFPERFLSVSEARWMLDQIGRRRSQPEDTYEDGVQDGRHQMYGELLGMKKERDHWRANHDNQVALKLMLQDRRDLPADRTRAYRELERLQAQVAYVEEQCGHWSHDRIDQTSMDDPAKRWRCAACGRIETFDEKATT